MNEFTLFPLTKSIQLNICCDVFDVSKIQFLCLNKLCLIYYNACTIFISIYIKLVNDSLIKLRIEFWVKLNAKWAL